MRILKRISNSAKLVDGMAKRLDYDISGKVGEAPETAARDYANLVMRCTFCKDQDACAELQDGHEHLEEAPDYCRNREVIRRR